MSCNWHEETVWQGCSHIVKGQSYHNASNIDDWPNCTADVKPSVYTIVTGGCIIEQPEYIDPGNSGGGNSGGGGPGGVGSNECTTVANNPGEVGIIDENGCHVGGATQPNDTRPGQKMPCQSIKTITADAKYKAHEITLKSKGHLNYEVGYKLSYPVPSSGQSGTQDQVVQNYPGTRVLDFTPTNYTFAFLHSHHNNMYSIFSPDDLASLNRWIVGAIALNNDPNNLQKINLKEISITVVTFRGTYLISFDGTSIDPYPNYTQKKWEKLDDLYVQLMRDAGNDSNPDYMEKIETQFLKFTNKHMPMPGMKLFKVESTGNTEIYLENGNRKTKECPK